MEKIAIIVFLFLIVVSLSLWYFFIFEKLPEQNQPSAVIDVSKITNEEITGLLKTNAEGLHYIEKYKDFKIENKTPLTKESILAGRQGPNFKEVYQGLDLEDNRYLRADLMNAAGNQGLIAVLDFKNNSVVKAFGLLLLSAGVEAK